MSYAYRPRTTVGSFYHRAAKHNPIPQSLLRYYPEGVTTLATYVRVDAIYPDPFVEEPGSGDWYVVLSGPLTWGDVDGPMDNSCLDYSEMKLCEFHSFQAHWKKTKEEKLSPKWKAFFKRYPIEVNEEK